MVDKNNKWQVSEATRGRYFNSLQEQVHQLRLCMERSDYNSAREICHRVRGSAGLFGLKDLGEACREMEEACLANNSGAVLAGFQVVEVIVSRSTKPAEAS